MNDVQFFDGSHQETIVAVSGWGTGHDLFASLRKFFNVVSVVPLHLPTCVDDIKAHLNAIQPVPKLAVGVSMGAPISAQLGLLKTVVVGINFGFSRVVLKAIQRQLDLNGLGYLSEFRYRCVACSEDLSWTQALDTRPWTLETLKAGLVDLRYNHWVAKTSRPTHIVHGVKDLIAPYDPVLNWARRAQIPLTSLDQAGHLPFGPSEFYQLKVIIENELAPKRN